MNPSQASIAIIGAGPSGLILARLLELARIAYVIFERDESAHAADEHLGSGTLDIQESSGQLALKEAGLMAEFQSVARYGVPTRIADAKGRIHLDIPEGSDEDKPEIDRKDLQKILLDSIPAGNVRWGCKIQDVKQENDGSLSVHSLDGLIASGFRLSVGADGAWSKVRQLVTSIQPHYSGTQFFTTFIEPNNPIYPSVTSIAKKGNYLALGNGQQIFLHYLGGGSYHLSVGVKAPEKGISRSKNILDPSALWQSFLQHEFAGWAPELTALIKASDRGFRSWPLYSMPQNCLPWGHFPGVTLLGDAAHLTVPSGTGVSNALYDGLELARQIVKHGVDGLEAAVIDYERAILPRAVAAIENGQWYMEHFFGAEGPQSFLQAVSMQKNSIRGA